MYIYLYVYIYIYIYPNLGPLLSNPHTFYPPRLQPFIRDPVQGPGYIYIYTHVYDKYSSG